MTVILATVTVMTGFFYMMNDTEESKALRFVSSLALGLTAGLPIGAILAAPVMQ